MISHGCGVGRDRAGWSVFWPACFINDDNLGHLWPGTIIDPRCQVGTRQFQRSLTHPFRGANVGRSRRARLVSVHHPAEAICQPSDVPRRSRRACGHRRLIGTFAGGMLLALLIEPLLSSFFPFIAVLIRALIAAQKFFPALFRAIRAAISVSAVTPQVHVEFHPAFQADAFA
jgi:hypothetical protein